MKPIKKNIVLMYAIALTQGMVFYGPIATLYRQVRGVSVFQITLLESISALLSLALELPWGMAAEKLGYKRTIVLCNGLFFLSKVVFWRADSFFGFLLERVMLSVVVAGLSGVDTSVLYLSCREEESQRVFGIYNSLGMAGLLAASLIFAEFVGDDHGLAALLTVCSYGAAAVLSLFLTEVKPREQCHICLPDMKAACVQTLRDRRLLLLLTAVALMSQTHQTITVFLNQVKYEACGLSVAAMGKIYVVVTLTGILGGGSHRLTRQLGTRNSGSWLLLTASAACFLLAVTGRASGAVCGILLLRLADSLFQPMQLKLQNRWISGGNRAAQLSINAMLIDCIGAGTSVLLGALAAVDAALAFFAGGALCLTSLALFRAWSGPGDSPHKRAD